MDWLVPILSVSISALVTVIINLFSKAQERAKFYSQIISSDRLAWVEKMREASAEFFALAEMEKRTPEEEKRMLVLKNTIIVRLFPSGTGTLDDEALAILLAGKFGAEEIAALRNILPRIFSAQWRRIKIEAGKAASKVATKNIEHDLKK